MEHRARGGAHRCRRVIPRLSGDLLRVILRELRSSGAVSCDMVCKIDVGRHGLARVQEGLNLIGRANVALYRELPLAVFVMLHGAIRELQPGGGEEEELTSRTACSEVCDKPQEGPSTLHARRTDSRLESPTLLAVSLRGGSGGRRGARSHLRPTSHAPGLTRLGSTYSFQRRIHVRNGSGGRASRSAAAAASPELTGPRE